SIAVNHEEIQFAAVYYVDLMDQTELEPCRLMVRWGRALVWDWDWGRRIRPCYRSLYWGSDETGIATHVGDSLRENRPCKQILARNGLLGFLLQARYPQVVHQIPRWVSLHEQGMFSLFHL